MGKNWKDEMLTDEELQTAQDYANKGLAVSRAVVGKMHRDLMYFRNDSPMAEEFRSEQEAYERGG